MAINAIHDGSVSCLLLKPCDDRVLVEHIEQAPLNKGDAADRPATPPSRPYAGGAA